MSETTPCSARAADPVRRQVITGVAIAFVGLAAGSLVGRNAEPVPNQRIVQAWRPASWDPDVYSMVRFEIKGQPSGSTVVLDHTGFPGGHARHREPLKRFLS